MTSPIPNGCNALREFLQSLDLSLPKSGALRAAQFNGILERVKGREVEKLVNEVVLRTPGAGRICRRELRPFRPEPAALCALHLADPALCRPGRASRTHPRAWVRQGWLARADGCDIARGNFGHHFGRRTARHEGGTRDLRPADRALSRRPDRRDLRGPHFRRHPRGAVRQARRHRRGRFRSRRAPSATNISAITRTCTPWSATSPAATHRLGDRVTVRLVEAAPVAGALRFELLTEGRYNNDGRTPARAARKRSAGGQSRRAVRETGRKRRR